MRKMLVITLFILATLAWAAPQQPGSTPEPSGEQAGSQGQANVPVTEGCLGGSDPNFTITDKAGTTYKLNIPPTADTSKLPQHVGESVQVAGNVKDTGKAANASIFKALVEERASAQPAVRRIPIVDGENRVIGIVAQAYLALKEKPDRVQRRSPQSRSQAAAPLS
jgi:hypothetical protein